MDVYVTALLMGVLGSGHCVAMCGSLSMALGFSIPREKHFLSYSILISLGRLLGYAFIGLIAAFFAQSIIQLTAGGIIYLSLVSAVLMFGIGLHIANLNSLVLKTEVLGKFITPIIDPIKKRLLPINNPVRCLGYGFFWGFLPCGLVYTALGLSLTAITILDSVIIMLMFGIGTLPTLVGLTAFSSKLNGFLEKSYVRFSLGAVVIIMACFQFYNASLKLVALN